VFISSDFQITKRFKILPFLQPKICQGEVATTSGEASLASKDPVQSRLSAGWTRSITNFHNVFEKAVDPKELRVKDGISP
jgi:hypothetical protein